MKASTVWWILCVVAGVLGVASAGVGFGIEAAWQHTSGLFLVVLSPAFLAVAGIFATVAAKLQSEGK